MDWINTVLNIYPATPKGLTVVGLLLDLVGISLLFFFQVDLNHAKRADGASLLILNNDEEEASSWKRKRLLTKVGFIFLIVGFLLQICGAFLS